MTDQHTRFLCREIKKLRKQIAELESGLFERGPNINPELWQMFQSVNSELVQYEQSLSRVNQGIVEDLQQMKTEISGFLADYMRSVRSLREMEKFFAVNILRPGYILKQASRQRKYLEESYAKLRAAVIEAQFDSLQTLESEIQKVLVHSESAYKPDPSSFKDEQTEENALWEMIDNFKVKDRDDVDHEKSIEQDFKRIVLPAVHPDTSETPNEIFLEVMAVFQAKDYLLMEAYVAEYRELADLNGQQDLIAVFESCSEDQKAYHCLLERMKDRMNALQSQFTHGELDQPEQVKQDLIQQREEIKQSIQAEAEKIFQLRQKIQDLTHLYLQMRRKDDDR